MTDSMTALPLAPSSSANARMPAARSGARLHVCQRVMGTTLHAADQSLIPQEQHR